MRSSVVLRLDPKRWLIWLIPACLWLCGCATPTVPPDSGGANQPVGAGVEQRVVLPAPAKTDRDDPPPQRDRLERRLQAVVHCLETAREAVVAAEVAGAGVEAVRPAVQALRRSEEALREAQAQWLSGAVDQVASPLDTAEAECRAARAFNEQT